MPRYTDALIAKHIKGCRGYIKIVAQRIGCSRNTIAKRISENKHLQEAMEEEIERKGDDAEILLEQMMAEKIPVVATILKVDKKTGKEKIVHEQRQVFSRSAASALIFYHKTKLKKRGYMESRGSGEVNDKQETIDDQLKALAEAMMK
jgi:hypothetical protein